MTGRVQGLACIVTGAGSGIGAASAIRLAEEGGKVVCADINGAAAEATVIKITAAGGTFEILPIPMGKKKAKIKKAKKTK